MSISGIGASNPAWYHAGRTQRGGADNKTARISENTKQPAFADKVNQAAQQQALHSRLYCMAKMTRTRGRRWWVHR